MGTLIVLSNFEVGPNYFAMIRNRIHLLSLLFFMVILLGAQDVAFSQELEAKTDKYLVEAEDFKKSIEKNKGIVLDVRTPKEYNESHISGAINIDYKNDNFRSEIGKLDKGKKYYIYCRSGKRSANSRKIMNELGIKKVYDLDGGILAWKKKEYPIE